MEQPEPGALAGGEVGIDRGLLAEAAEILVVVRAALCCLEVTMFQMQ